MNHRATLSVLTALMAPIGVNVSAQDHNPLVGSWRGTLEVPGASLRLVLTVSAVEGGLDATFASVDQGNQPVPVSAVSLDGDRVAFSLDMLGASFAGTMHEGQDSVGGTFSQGGADLPLTLRRVTAEEASTARPQDPKGPLPYAAEDVTFTNPDGGHTLAGTLTSPLGDGPFPAVVLISGSGPQDRNETLVGHRPFLVLSDHLTRAGIAVLRFDDRGVGESTGDFAAATSRDFASDVTAAVAFLKDRAIIDGANIGLAGHSEGGLIAPMVAAESPDVAFLVLMAGPGVNGEEILYAQSELISQAAGQSSEKIRENRVFSEKVYALMKGPQDQAELAEAIEALIREQFATATPEELAENGVTEANLEQVVAAQATALTSPWFRYFLTYEPAESLERVRVPVLAINGEKDLQVPHGQNLPAIGAALERGGNTDFELHVLPGLNHLFQHAETGSPTEYGEIEETWAPSAMALISDWILATVGKPAA